MISLTSLEQPRIIIKFNSGQFGGKMGENKFTTVHAFAIFTLAAIHSCTGGEEQLYLERQQFNDEWISRIETEVQKISSMEEELG